MTTLRVAALTIVLSLLSGCGDFGQKQHTLLGDNVPGLSDMYAPSKEEKADEAWWDKFYGNKPAE